MEQNYVCEVCVIVVFWFVGYLNAKTAVIIT